jgi:hypothetical protein
MGESIRRLLGGESNDRDRAAGCHLLKDSLKKLHRARWQLDRLLPVSVANTQRQRSALAGQQSEPLSRRTG